VADTVSKGLPAPNELLQWLRLLVLPLWARIAVLLVLVAVLTGGIGVLGTGLWTHDAEGVSLAVKLLTVALPVMLVVVALVFGQNSDERLRQLTTAVLEKDIVRALEANFGDAFGLSVVPRVRGCCADYEIRRPGSADAQLRFTLELNVYKVNVCFWLDDALPGRLDPDTAALAPFRHVILGARAEGYALNEEPARYDGTGQGTGLLFFRRLADDFLLQPGQRLYFAQDLSFFVRGMLEARSAPEARA
jgi:hypothetical protein